MNEAPTAPASEAPATTPAHAEATTQPVPQEQPQPKAPETAPAPEATKTLTPEEDAAKKARDAQDAINRVIQQKEDQCAAEIQKVCEKFGCELIVGHSVKVKFKQR